MIVKTGESRQTAYRSGTYDGVVISASISHGTANTGIASSDFNASQVNVKVTLKRKNQNHVIMQDNLLVLATFCSLVKGYDEFLNGIDKTYAASGVKAVKLRTVKLDFGGHIRVGKDDELIVEVTPNQAGTFSNNIDSTASYLEFEATPSIGYEEGIPQTISEVIQASTTKQGINAGDNVVKLMVLNFDKNDISSEVVSNLALQSDRLDLSMSLNQLLNWSLHQMPRSVAKRYGSSLPISSGSPTVLRGLNYLPQSYLVFDGTEKKQELDQVRLDISFNGANVSASQNYVVWTKVETDLETLKVAAQREQKHQLEKIEKLGG